MLVFNSTLLLLVPSEMGFAGVLYSIVDDRLQVHRFCSTFLSTAVLLGNYHHGCLAMRYLFPITVIVLGVALFNLEPGLHIVVLQNNVFTLCSLVHYRKWKNPLRLIVVIASVIQQQLQRL